MGIEQKDFLLREIEKIGMMLRAFLGRKAVNIQTEECQTELVVGNLFEELKEQAGFDLKHFLSLEDEGALDYLSGFRILNNDNLELLAQILFLEGMGEPGHPKDLSCMQKSLLLSNYCSEIDKTFSFEREARIHTIIDAMQ